MWRPVFFVLTITLSTFAIRVPVEGKNDTAKEPEPTPASKKQDVLYITDDALVDSYLIPPDPHRPVEVLPELIGTPATYLLPPSPEKQIDYYAPTEDGEQTDWYPIRAQIPSQSTPVLLPHRQPELIPIFLPNNQTFEVIETPRGGKAYDINRVQFHPPSRQLEPPVENSPSEYVISKPSDEFQLPSTEINQPFNAQDYEIPVRKPTRKNRKNNKNIRLKAADPTLALHLTPPKLVSQEYKNPTKLYPKKVTQGFQPVPIPLFAEAAPQVPRAKPAKPFKPLATDETEYFTPTDEKKIYLYQQAEQKRKLKENEAQLQSQQPAELVGPGQDAYGANAAAEQETSETIYSLPGRNAYPAPLRRAPPRAPPSPASAASPPPAPAPGERTEFRMHGMKGPHSYQFGFDTGKGKNRQFRYEERDDGGRVKGHYGYMDRDGKMRVVNYNADPETGFHADTPKETQ